MHSIKRNSSRDIHRALKNLYSEKSVTLDGKGTFLHGGGLGTSTIYKQGRFQWQKSFKDHVITDEDDFIKHIEYIKANPVKAGLVEKPEDYPFLFVDEGAIAAFLGYGPQ